MFSQNIIQEFTLSIIDTSNSQTEQAHDIYRWLTTNISYDIRSLTKGEYPNLLPLQLIKQGEGLSSDYANLLKEMCKSVGIEAYIIQGYSKGYLYNKQKPFLRANHSWNIVYVDSVWMHIDPTWGSGYVDAKPRAYEKVLNKVAHIPYANTKIYFSKSNTEDFFNIAPDLLIKTHYPLDPKWLFSETPIDFYTFQDNTIDENTYVPYYREEIEKIRNKSSELQYIIEGENAIKYNTLNYFDLANAYFKTAVKHNIERDITENNLWQFEIYYKEYSVIVEAISKYKALNDSVYRARKTQLRQVARDQKKLSGRIKSKAKKAKQTHKSSQKQIVGKNSSYRKKMNTYQINIGRSEIKKIPFIILSEIQYTDTSQVESLKNEIQKLKVAQPILNHQLDSLIGVVDNFSLKDAQIDDSIAFANNVFKTNIDSLWLMILSGNESVIVDYVDSLKVIYKDIEDFLSDKKNAKSDLQNTGRAFYTYSGLLQKSYKQEMTLNTKLQKLTNHADSIIKAYNQSINNLIACYRKSMVFTKKLTTHNDLQTNVRQANLEALKEQKKSINKENKFFIIWYDNHIQREKEIYIREKEIIKQIKSTSIRNLKTVEVKIKKHKQIEK